jgi:hypothetical protein
MKSWLCSAFAVVGLAGCAGDTDDTFYLTGTEEYAVKTENGEYVCEAPKKELICHIPPGNPDNAHTICVSRHAVAAHQEHHGDPIGPCDGGGDGDPDAGVDPDPDPEPAPDAGDGDPPVPDVD